MKRTYEAPKVIDHQMIQFETKASGKKDKDDKKKGF